MVGKELGVRYVLEGSVRKFGDKVRITAQLIDAKTNHHLGAKRYDREMKDIFALQDEITMKTLTALEVNLSEGEQAVMMVKGTRNLEAYLKVLQSTFYRRRLNVEDNVKARRLTSDPQGGTNHPKSLFADFNFDLIFIDKIVKCRLLDWIPAYAGRTSMVSI